MTASPLSPEQRDAMSWIVNHSFRQLIEYIAELRQEKERFTRELQWANRELGKVFPHVSFESHEPRRELL